ncbi:MAG TPA: phosphatidylglycerophosphatase A [Acidiferrobacter sp.]|nr:phosphatidylglycerophosphatase A [Acidiferrobacter sp.]
MAKISAATFLATGFGVGRFPKAPGTAGSLLGLVLWWPVMGLGWPGYSLLLVVALGVGVVASGRAAIELGLTDPPMVVWDEVVGMGVALLAVPHGLLVVLAAFGLFRLFDITKPYPIKRLERLPGGYGIMLDDVLAGVYANVCLQGVLWILSGAPH